MLNAYGNFRRKKKYKNPIELLAIGDLNGLDIKPTHISSGNTLPWMLDQIQPQSFREINQAEPISCTETRWV